MQPKKLEALIWVLIYGGLLLISLSIFVHRSSGILGWFLSLIGGASTLLGVILIVIRSRMKNDSCP